MRRTIACLVGALPARRSTSVMSLSCKTANLRTDSQSVPMLCIRGPSTRCFSGSAFHTSGNKVHFISLGCARNLVDTEVMLGILLKAGYEVATELEDADNVVINTCGFLQAAREESVETIKQTLKERKEASKVIVTGCMVQSHRDEIRKECPDVDFLLGSGDVEEILNAVQAKSQGETVTTARSYLEAGEVPRTLSTPPHYAYLKIAEGCRKRCAFCIIPKIKGPLRSKPVERVKKEFGVLLDRGVKEVILIAQDLGDWGKDLRDVKDRRQKKTLVHLLKSLLEEEGYFWLRLLYLYPDEIDDDLIAVLKSDERVCPYLDMPIQHINSDILAAMKRKTSREQIVATLRKLRREIPDVVIRTSLMVGFPGETEAQFEELLAFVDAEELDNVGIFAYSHEDGSRAASLPHQVSAELKEERVERLAAAQLRVVERRNRRRMVGRVLPVVVEGRHPESDLLMRGRHQGQCPEVDGEVIVNDGRAVHRFGEWYHVEITGVAGHDLVGRVIAPLFPPDSE